jgi:hypothetical protein
MSIKLSGGGGTWNLTLAKISHGDYVFYVRVQPHKEVTSMDVSSGTFATLISTFSLALGSIFHTTEFHSVTVHISL